MSESMKATWYDVLGTSLTAQETLERYEETRESGETVAEWIERMNRELWAAERGRDEDWKRMARELERDARLGARA